MYSLTFDRPWYLLLLAVLPLLWWFSYRSLAGLGRWRRFSALALRSMVLLLIVAALAEAQLVLPIERMTVVYLLDQSRSIPEPQRRAMVERTNQAIVDHRRDEVQVAVIGFGREPAIEIPPVDYDFQVPLQTESSLDPNYTDLAAAVKLAQATFPEDSSKRIVIVSDGNQNLGDVLAEAHRVADAGIGIDVQPVSYEVRSEVSVEKITVPAEMRQGEPFEVRVVMNNVADQDAPPVSGTLRITRSAEGRSQVVAQQPVSLGPGIQVFSVRQEIDKPNFYRWDATFVPDEPDGDSMSQNNRATNFTYSRGTGQVLLLEDHLHRDEFNFLVDQLRLQNIEVTVRPSNQLPTSLAELQAFDTVVLANVPREHFSDEQIEMLVSNTQRMGAGLVMLGGPNSFAAGGWEDTELERAMPVDFEIKNLRVAPSGALVLVIDKSGSMSGEKIAMSRAAAIAAVEELGPKDYIGVVAFDGGASWIVPMQQIEQHRDTIVRRIKRLNADGGTDMFPGMNQAYHGIKPVKTAIKHMIVLSDAQTQPGNFNTLTRQMRQADITVSTIAVGQDADRQLLSEIAHEGGGKFYAVTNPRVIPKIFMKEARRVARPVIYEREEGLVPQKVYPHEMLSGIEAPLPPVTGMVLTTVKDNPLVEVSLISPSPTEQENATLLASWMYGSGKAVALTTDVGQRWGKAWTEWDGYDKFFAQVLRWSMRRWEGDDNFTVSVDVRDGQGEVVVTALDPSDEFLNFLSMTGTVVGPDLEPRELNIDQVAPGRYVGHFATDAEGSYFVMMSPGGNRPPLRAGVNVSTSDEFRDRHADLPLLTSLAGLKPNGGEAGVLIEPIDGGHADSAETVSGYNPFRHDLPKVDHRRDAWYLLVFVAAIVFFADVFNRRVHADLAWVAPLADRVWTRIVGRPQVISTSPTIDRLRNRKAAVNADLASRRVDVQPQPQGDQPSGSPIAEEMDSTSESSPAPSKPSLAATEEEPASYTQRLLEAKKRVWDEE